MSDNKNNESKTVLNEGYQPVKKGFQPKKVVTSTPPKGGSGVTPKNQGNKEGSKK